MRIFTSNRTVSLTDIETVPNFDFATPRMYHSLKTFVHRRAQEAKRRQEHLGYPSLKNPTRSISMTPLIRYADAGINNIVQSFHPNFCLWPRPANTLPPLQAPKEFGSMLIRPYMP